MARRRNNKPKPDELPPAPTIKPTEETMEATLEQPPEVTAPDEPTDLENPHIETPQPMAGVSSVPVESVPLADLKEGVYATRRIDLRLIREDAGLANTLKQIHEGLYKSAATLPGGRHIKSPADAIKWLLYQVQQATPTA